MPRAAVGKRISFLDVKTVVGVGSTGGYSLQNPKDPVLRARKMPHILLRPAFLQFRNRWRSGQSAGRRNLLLLAVTGLIMLCIFLAFRMILLSVASEKLLSELIAVKLVELLFSAFFILQLFSCTVAAIGNVYNAENMSLLLSAPISNRRLFLAKFAETLIETGGMLLIFATPIGLAFVSSLEVSPLFFPVAIVLSFMLMLIPCGWAFVFGTFFVRVASFFWKRGALLLGVLACTSAYVLYRLFDFFANMRVERGAGAIIELVGIFESSSPLWSPTRWASDILNSLSMAAGFSFHPNLPCCFCLP